MKTLHLKTVFSFILLCLISNVPLRAQYTHYEDTSWVSSFNYLSGATSVNNGVFWDDDSYSIPIGFMFKFFNDSTNTIYLNGDIGSGAMLLTKPSTMSTVNISGMMPNGADLQDKDTSTNGSFSPISYALTGTAPNRIFKMEWRNAGFFNSISNGVYSDSTNFQIWFHENGHMIDVIYGPSNYVSPFADLYDGGPGPLIAIFDSINISDFTMKHFYYLTGSPSNPTMDSLDDFSSIVTPPGLNGHAQSGRVYRFKPYKAPAVNVGYTSQVLQQSHDIRTYTGQPTLLIDIYNQATWKYRIISTQGAMIQTGQLQSGSQQISTQSLSPGTYLIQLESENRQFTYRFMR